MLWPVFCDTKRRCENVAELLAKMIYNRPAVCQQILDHRAAERAALTAQLTVEGAGFICPVLAKTLRFGIGYHHRLVSALPIRNSNAKDPNICLIQIRNFWYLTAPNNTKSLTV
jgi:hypothetical protein